MADLFESDIDRASFLKSLTGEQREAVMLVEQCFELIHLYESESGKLCGKAKREILKELHCSLDDLLAYLAANNIMLISPPTFEVPKGRN